MADSKKFKNRIRVVLAEKRKTQKWFQEQMGWSAKHTSLVVNEKADTKPETWIKIAELLDTTVKYLLEERE